MAASLLILAGGYSRRLGTPKHLLPCGGATLLEHVYAQLAPAFDEVLVSSRQGEVQLRGARPVADVIAGAGPLSGIAAGLQAATHDAVFAVACDMPRLSVDLARFLVEQLNGHDAAVPTVGGRPEPICAAYAKSAADKIEAALRDDVRSAARALARLDVRYVGGLNADLFASVNTPHDVERMLVSS